MYDDNYHSAKIVLDTLSYGFAISAFFGFLPPLAALMSVLWVGFQIYDRIKYGPRNKKE